MTPTAQELRSDLEDLKTEMPNRYARLTAFAENVLSASELPEIKKEIPCIGEFLKGYEWNKCRELCRCIVERLRMERDEAIEKYTSAISLMNEGNKLIDKLKSENAQLQSRPVVERLKMELAEEKAVRIKYQNITYKICQLFDTSKEKCTIDVVADKVRGALEGRE